MLVELGLVEQRYQVVRDVLDAGVSVTEAAQRAGVTRQSVHRWLRHYATQGLAGLADRPSAPGSCPHQMTPETEAAIVVMRREHPGWGPCTIGHWLMRQGVDPLPGRSSIYRCLVRHGLIIPETRKRKRSDYKRWERSKAMALWQMDIVGGVHLRDGSEAKIVTGVDDHSRFCISALVVQRATARPTCEALTLAMGRFGVPSQILTDNGKVFTGRFGPGTGEVLFDRICRENGIKHLLTAPRSPTTTGKVERFHRTLRHRQGLRRDRRCPGPARCVGGDLQPRPAPPGHRHGRSVRALPLGHHRAPPRRSRRRNAGRHHDHAEPDTARRGRRQHQLRRHALSSRDVAGWRRSGGDL